MAYVVSSDQYVIQTSVPPIFLRMAVGKVFNGNCRMVLDPTISKLAFADNPRTPLLQAPENPKMISPFGPLSFLSPYILLWPKWFFNVFNFEKVC